jgi:hypothetical protein
MPRTGWLHSRWIMALFDEQTGNQRLPRVTDLNLIRYARNLWRRARVNQIVDEFDQGCAELQKANTEAAKVRSRQRIVNAMRKHDFTEHAGRRIRNPWG